MMRIVALLNLCAVSLFLATPLTRAANSVSNGAPFDLQGFLDKELAEGKKEIVVPPGRYRVTPRQRQHLVLRNLRDVRIVADGVEMICTETTRALSIVNCTN